VQNVYAIFADITYLEGFILVISDNRTRPGHCKSLDVITLKKVSGKQHYYSYLAALYVYYESQVDK